MQQHPEELQNIFFSQQEEELDADVSEDAVEDGEDDEAAAPDVEATDDDAF